MAVRGTRCPSSQAGPRCHEVGLFAGRDGDAPGARPGGAGLPPHLPAGRLLVPQLVLREWRRYFWEVALAWRGEEDSSRDPPPDSLAAGRRKIGRGGPS